MSDESIPLSELPRMTLEAYAAKLAAENARLRGVLEVVGRTETRATGVVACARCNMRLEYCDGALPLGVCLGQIARAALEPKP